MTGNIKIENGKIIFPNFTVGYKSMYINCDGWTKDSIIGYIRGVIDAMWYQNNITTDEGIDALSQVISEIDDFTREYI